VSPLFKSGAFVQQCFSVHPLCLHIKKLVSPEQIILSCSSCSMAHRLTIRSLATQTSTGLSEAERSHGESAGEQLASCIGTHHTALRVNRMDVLREAVGFRCDTCRRTFEVDVALFETHQR